MQTFPHLHRYCCMEILLRNKIHCPQNKSEHHDILTRKFQHTACASSDLHKNGTKILNLEEMSDPCRRISE